MGFMFKKVQVDIRIDFLRWNMKMFNAAKAMVRPKKHIFPTYI